MDPTTPPDPEAVDLVTGVAVVGLDPGTAPPAIFVHIYEAASDPDAELAFIVRRRRPPRSAIAMDIWNGDHEVIIR